MQKRKVLFFVGIVGSVLLSGVSPSHAKTLHYHERSSGSFHNTVIDTNGDTIPATVSLVQGNTSAGRMQGETFGEFRPLGINETPSGECTPGTVELAFVNGIGINRFGDGSILVLAPTFSVLCLDPASATGTFINKGVFLDRGSTKRFAKASGSWETHGTVVGLVFAPSGTVVAGTVTFELTGTLTLP